MNGTLPKHDVIVIGAGVVGPCIATALARQGRKVLIIERDWSRPERIVGELLQPAGVKALQELGMVQAINGIDAQDVVGYYIKFGDEDVVLEYPSKQETAKTNPVKPLRDCVYEGNDKIVNDETLDAAAWESDENVRGVGFSNGDFLMNIRRIAKNEPNVTCVEGNATKLLYSKEHNNTVVGVAAKVGEEVVEYYADMTIGCDGIYSKFRRTLFEDKTPSVGSYFVGLSLKNAVLPHPHRGHVILGKHAPVLIYQTTKTDTRILCAYRSTKPPSVANNELFSYLEDEVLPALPKETQPSFKEALATRKFKAMPNQYLTAASQGSKVRGFVLVGDSLNMRHPLTGGGMTVGLNDAVLLARLLHPMYIPDLSDYSAVRTKLQVFHKKRKNLDAVVNTLSIALYTLFAADSRSLIILQKGCMKYFLRGGDCVSGPMGLLSGMFPFPMLLFNHFFSVVFYAIYLNFVERGLLLAPLALFEAIATIGTSIVVFTPYLWAELVQ
ncbi:Piso0_001702 [Millerozyma farinosa CBS 7064]|uniref:Squalene monooxygenase n=1 Tax=Pichia sorbitophila (strain ATCC MYA-4447 / BCRC 22081 / CBS 7064 / NBRC 10061 / NRRL Y-12695) TaxID=559304 RepID=G8YLH8_PICSO|nr:Piso0_001702 [Millerozyma farinosa CBS 7064]